LVIAIFGSSTIKRPYALDSSHSLSGSPYYGSAP